MEQLTRRRFDNVDPGKMVDSKARKVRKAKLRRKNNVRKRDEKQKGVVMKSRA
jgi:hypothetical protein